MTSRIRLGTGVISLPYHHPFNVAQRIVQLDHMTGGRAIFGSGPGALPSDAHTLAIEPIVQRDRQDEALSVIIAAAARRAAVLVRVRVVHVEDAQLQLLPLQENIEMMVASSLSPSGMQLAGKYGMGALSIASTSSEGLQALPTQWAFAEEAAQKHGQKVDRKNWRVMMSWHLAETKEKAKEEAMYGLQSWHNDYNVHVLGRPGATKVEDAWKLIDETAGGSAEGGGTAVVGTPDELVTAIRKLQDVTGGFGTVMGFVHDWANPENTAKSWDLFARYVIPQINGYVRNLETSADFLHEKQKEFMGKAGAAVMAKIAENEKASAAMKITMQQAAQRKQGGEFRPNAPEEMAGEKKS